MKSKRKSKQRNNNASVTKIVHPRHCNHFRSAPCLPNFDVGHFDDDEEILVNIIHEHPTFLQYPSACKQNSCEQVDNEAPSLSPYPLSTLEQESILDQIDLTDIFNGWEEAMSPLWWKLLSPLNTFPSHEITGPEWKQQIAISHQMVEALTSVLKDPIKYKPVENNDGPCTSKKAKICPSNGQNTLALGNNNNRNSSTKKTSIKVCK